MAISYQLTNLEKSVWTREWSVDINPVKPEGYEIIQLPDGMRLYNTGPAYCGWLAKCVSPFPYPFTRASLSFNLLIDDAVIQQAQVIEFDSKFTDANGWTYDGSGQLNIAEGWMFQIGNPWVDTGVKISPLFSTAITSIRVEYLLNYVNHSLSVVALTTGTVMQPMPSTVLPIAAKQVGWADNQVVTQLQQCNNGLRGAHSWKVNGVGYSMTA